MMLACALLALQAESAPTLVADAGWRGRVFADGWAPVLVRVQTSGAFEGRLVVRVHRAFGEDLVITRALSIGGRVDRRFPMEFLSMGYELGADVEVMDARGRVVAQLPLTLSSLPQSRRRVLVLGDATDGLRRWARDSRTQLVAAGEDGLPFTLAPLLGFETVVVGRAPEILPAQEEALRRYVSLGGRLVAMTGSRAMEWRSHTLSSLLPAEVTGTERVGDGVIGRWQARDGEVFARVEGQPGGVRARRDRGEVAMLAFAPESGAAAREGTAWEALLGDDAVPRRSPRFGSGLPPLFTPIAGDLVGVRAGPVLAGTAVALVYVLLIGPLQARMRRAWRPAWLRLTACAGVFSAVFWVMQARYGAVPTQLREVTLEDHAGVTMLRQSFGVFVPREGGVHAVSGGEAAAVAVVPHAMQVVPGLPEEPVEAPHAGGLRVALPAGARRAFVCARAGESALVVRRRGGVLLVKADGRALEEAVLAGVDEVLHLGSVAAGETREIDLGAARREAFDSWAREKKDLAGFEAIVRERIAYGVTFHSRWTRRSSIPDAGWRPSGMEMRGLDLCEHLARGASIFVARAVGGDGVLEIEGATVARRAVFVRVVVEP